MRNGAKTTKTLELEKESQQEILHKAQTVGECIAPLDIIAAREGLKLTNPSDYKYAVQILRNPKR